MICGQRYKALMANSSSNIDRALTIEHDNDSLSLKNTTRHPITLKSLFTDVELVDDDVDVDDGSACGKKHKNCKFWKTLGGKYLSFGKNKKLFISSKKATKFLYKSINNGGSSNMETFYLCAIYQNVKYLVSPSKSVPSVKLQGECKLPKQLKKTKRYQFVAVYFNVSDYRFSDEIDAFCQ
ncbi:uncharacterized protein LOC134182719 [Corticium candelabrum]|uniref:uncharacterized protein LOC134182719 n=1 Tax=Corticium candelabrum TaxID=121492 RepID=UPI002E26DF8C|nr:uncharacterized protein LOC134182719 [Corticium candelabrum]